MTLMDFVEKCYRIFRENRSFARRYTFENRSKNSENLCIILAGYKEFTWDIIFDRINKFSNNDIDICILSSGLYSKRLSDIAKKYNWSYLSTKQNKVTLIQNTAIKLFPNAKFIYKLDEDIFVTKNFFNTLKETYFQVQNEERYEVGFVAPMIPINAYCYGELLRILNLEDYYEKHFEKIKYRYDEDVMIVYNPDVSRFLWGENNLIPQIDDLDKLLNNSKFSYSASTIRFNIGAILFPREVWEKMLYFKVDFTNGLGRDETQLCSYCITTSRAMIVSENTCVGHLSFSLTNAEMEDYFKENPEKFQIKQ